MKKELGVERILEFEPGLEQLIELALQEDLGKGDITTELLIPKEKEAVGRIIAEEDAILCGIYPAKLVFFKLDSRARIIKAGQDGDEVKKGQVILEIQARASALLSGERTALNFLQHLSGVATLTQKFVEQVKHTRAKITATRKTIPILRGLQKYAVVVGGGETHRLRLDDGILIKDNHLEILGDLKKAVEQAKSRAPQGMPVEVEVESLEDFHKALEAGADIIMLDNMTSEQLKEVVKQTKGKVLLEASGGIRLENVREVAESGVDFVSVGFLTHSVPAISFSMHLEPI